MRRADLLLKQVQRATENERVGSTDGISTEEYYQYFTDGLRFLQRKIIAVHTTAFRTSKTYTASGSESYDQPSDIFSRNRIVSIEYKEANQGDEHYRRLERRTQLERFSGTGRPTKYILEGKTFKVNAYPSAGTFRVTYDFLLPAVDKRRGTVSARTKTTTNITALTLTGYTSNDEFSLWDHVTIVGFDGTIKMAGIPYTSVAAGVVTIQGGTYAFPSGSTCEVGDYYCLGANASSHPQIDDAAEDFLITYCQRRILLRDSSQDANDIAEELRPMWVDLIDVYAGSPDVEGIPVTNYDYWDDLG